MNRLSLLVSPWLAGILLASPPVDARIRPFGDAFAVRDIPTPDGETLHVRVGGKGPTVLLLHGFGDTGDMWEPLARELVRDHRVIIPDLRGLGLSSAATSGYDKKSQGVQMGALLDALTAGKVQLVTHDIGNMVGYALAAQQRSRVTAWVAMEAPLPGLGHWDRQLQSPKTWHFNFRGPDVERLVAGRERIFLDRFYDELSAHPERIDGQTRRHYAALYARPKAMHDAFEQFGAFAQDALDNRQMVRSGKLDLPVLAVGGERSYGIAFGAELGEAASNVTSVEVADAGHWLMEEQPAATVKLIVEFLARHP